MRMPKMGEFCTIEVGTIAGENVTIGNHVTIKKGTLIGQNAKLGDYVKTTGLCIIGDNVNIRTRACISKGIIINDWAFIGPGVMTNHTKNVYHGRPLLKEVQLITRIGYGAVIGSMCSLVAGLTIGDNVVIAAGTNVYKDILEAGIYGGYPLRKLKDVEPNFILPRPPDYQEYQFTEDELREYLPNWEGFQR